MNNLEPKKEHKFTFGIWTVGNPGRDPFGEPTRQAITPVTIVKRLSELGAYGVNFHDNDLVPIVSPLSADDHGTLLNISTDVPPTSFSP